MAQPKSLYILIAYLIGAFLCWKIFEKLKIENAWFAWIPILGTYITFVAGDDESPILWIILSLIPGINIVAAVKLIIAWVRICKKLGQSPWLLLICLVPYGAFLSLAIWPSVDMSSWRFGMVSSKPKKIIFLMLIAALAGGSMVAYAQSETSFLIKTVELVVLSTGCGDGNLFDLL